MKLESRLIDGEWRYFLNGRGVDERTYLDARLRNKQRGKRYRRPGCYGDATDWEKENGGRGRYCPQIARKPKDPGAYVRKRADLIKYAERNGFGVEKD